MDAYRLVEEAERSRSHFFFFFLFLSTEVLTEVDFFLDAVGLGFTDLATGWLTISSSSSLILLNPVNNIHPRPANISVLLPNEITLPV